MMERDQRVPVVDLIQAADELLDVDRAMVFARDVRLDAEHSPGAELDRVDLTERGMDVVDGRRGCRPRP